MPTTAQPSCGRPSTRIPATLRPSISTSLGHFTGLVAGDLGDREPGGQRQQPRRLADHERAEERLPGGAVQVRPWRPRPAVCSAAVTSVPCGAPARGELAGALVGRVGHGGSGPAAARAAMRRQRLMPGGSQLVVDREPEPLRGVPVADRQRQPRGRRPRRAAARRRSTSAKSREARPPPPAPSRSRASAAAATQSPAVLVAGVELDVAESVDVEGVGDERAVLGPRPRQLERTSSPGSSGVAGLDRAARPPASRAATGAKMSRPWKVAETGSSRERRAGDVDRLDHAAGALAGEPQQTVVGADQEPVVGEPERDRAALGADVRVDDREMDAQRACRGAPRAARARRPARPGAGCRG